MSSENKEQEYNITIPSWDDDEGEFAMLKINGGWTSACPRCDGSGSTDTGEPCPFCGGSGWRR